MQWVGLDIRFENIAMERPLQWPIWLGPAQQSDASAVAVEDVGGSCLCRVDSPSSPVRSRDCFAFLFIIAKPKIVRQINATTPTTLPAIIPALFSFPGVAPDVLPMD